MPHDSLERSRSATRQDPATGRMLRHGLFPASRLQIYHVETSSRLSCHQKTGSLNNTKLLLVGCLSSSIKTSCVFAGKASIALCKLVFLAAANDIMMLPTIRGEAGSTLDIGKTWKPAPPESQSHMEACASGGAGACFKMRGCARDPSGGRRHRGVCLPVLRSFELHTPPCSICTGSSPQSNTPQRCGIPNSSALP